MDDRIRELRRAGWSERRIAAKLGVTRHRVRTALDGLRANTPAVGEAWFEDVASRLAGAKYREYDDVQLPLTELAYDVAEWLDAHDDESSTAEHLVNSPRLVIKGVNEGSDPLVRIHVRRTFRLRDLVVPCMARGRRVRLVAAPITS